MREYLTQRLPYFFMATVVIALDRGTKAMVETSLSPWGSVSIIPGFFDLTYVRNPGGVFGIFKGLDAEWRGILFTVVPVAAILMIGAYAWKIPAGRRLTQGSLALILGGAVGNLIDRFRYGHVIDFLDFYWRDYHWPAFNVADSAICVGVAVLMFETLFTGEGVAPVEATGHRAGGDSP